MIIRARSYRRKGRLVPATARGLRARSMMLQPAEAVDWHSTHAREELLIALTGQMVLEIQSRAHRATRIVLRAGQCLFLPCQTEHRVINRSRANAHYLYVTGPTDG